MCMYLLRSHIEGFDVESSTSPSPKADDFKMLAQPLYGCAVGPGGGEPRLPTAICRQFGLSVAQLERKVCTCDFFH